MQVNLELIPTIFITYCFFLLFVRYKFNSTSSEIKTTLTSCKDHVHKGRGRENDHHSGPHMEVRDDRSPASGQPGHLGMAPSQGTPRVDHQEAEE